MNELPSDVFARRLRQERKRASISQAELARRIAQFLGTAVDPSAVTRIEQQTRAVRLDEAVAAAAALGVPLTALISTDPIEEGEREMQQALVDLEIAQRTWEESRIEVERLRRTVHVLTGEYRLDPALAENIDSRVALENGGEEGRTTDPDA